MAIVDFDPAFWTDGAIQAAAPLGKLLHAFLWTNPTCNTIGIYEISIITMSQGTGIPEQDIPELLKSIEPGVKYDTERHIVAVFARFRRQFMKTSKVSPKMVKAAERCLHSLPENHPFVLEWLKRYDTLCIPYAYGMYGVSGNDNVLNNKGEPDRVSIGYVYPMDTVQEGKGREGLSLGLDLKEDRGVGEEKKEGSNCLADHSFGEFKKLMPLTNGQFVDEADCEKYWGQHPAKWAQWLTAVKNYRVSKQVSDGVIMFPMTFLSKRWELFLNVEQPLGVGLSPPDYSWRDKLEADEAVQKEFDRAVKAGEITVRPRDRLPHESVEQYEGKKAAGKLPMVRV